ncbi:hypothetical protein VN97_g4402 [Penicillium thymicola]|uniref:Zn(2)-C6 fungal-type domain-containing protein n=1 Tax=Penicillium thymicola TaxID=293382 RepID=A0AAI9X9N2_PENTH|nr:hypothetical protein VN97_g4402 [Penicillium thymicola]
MKLSCSRCRDKKLKCDRSEPVCKRCMTSGFPCSYPARRKPRGERQKAEIRRSDRRLEAQENRSSAPTDIRAPDTPSPSQIDQATATVPQASEPEQGANTWIYRMVSGAKNSIESLANKGEFTFDPPPPWAQSTVNNAINRLDTALGQLAAPSPQPFNNPADGPNPNLLPCHAQRYLDTFFDIILPHLNVFDSFRNVVDPGFLRALPHIIDSPYAQVDPAMRIIYYSGMYFGQMLGGKDEQRLAILAYYRCLQSIPKWLESARGSQLGLLAASLTVSFSFSLCAHHGVQLTSIKTWLAINNFDYHLAWQFHCQACRFGGLLGIHDVDSSPSSTAHEGLEAEKEIKRRLHWYLVELDFLFRLWYDKPKALKSPIAQVKLPAEISPQTKQPKPAPCTLFIVWSRALFLLDEFFSVLESSHGQPYAEVSSKIDNCCNELWELLTDWDMLSVARSPRIEPVKSWLYADSIIALYSFIILMRRKASNSDRYPHPQAVNAARIVINTIIEWAGKNVLPSGTEQSFDPHLVTFYPFCAFFTLYYHIMSSNDPSEHEQDLSNLEKVVSIMTPIASVRRDFVPIVDAMGALNDASRAVHSSPDPLRGLTMLCPPSQPKSLPKTRFSTSQGGQALQQQVPRESEGVLSFPNTAQQFTPFDSLQNLSSILPAQPGDDPSGTFGIPFQLQNQITFGYEPGGNEPEPVEADTARTAPQPLEFVQAIENELIWRNWHESWWDSESGIDTAG